ncbi:MAG: hypothetical protein GY934_14315, partial [Gammaproteobacteria bacterium]|nr:hypothetical protein [Gammaproteobacteria bacterium]
NRKNRPTDKEHPQKPFLGKSKQSSYSSEIPIISAARTATPEERASNMRQEMPFDATHNDPDETISQAEHPATLLNHYEALTTGDTEMLDDDLPTPNTLLFEPSHNEAGQNEADQDIDSILTTVDVYLAYRRLTEAESILHNSIDKHPELPKLKAKLIEVYAFKKDTKLFTRYLEQYQDELASKAPELWGDILSIAKQLIPDHPSVADMHSKHTDEEPLTDSGATSPPESSGINLGPDTMVDELIIGDVKISEDELFALDQDEKDPFDIDLDIDEFNKGK